MLLDAECWRWRRADAAGGGGGGGGRLGAAERERRLQHALEHDHRLTRAGWAEDHVRRAAVPVRDYVGDRVTLQYAGSGGDK